MIKPFFENLAFFENATIGIDIPDIILQISKQHSVGIVIEFIFFFEL
jgi:hypothetical protein